MGKNDGECGSGFHEDLILKQPPPPPPKRNQHSQTIGDRGNKCCESYEMMDFGSYRDI